jgi:hypothetical protein
MIFSARILPNPKRASRYLLFLPAAEPSKQTSTRLRSGWSCGRTLLPQAIQHGVKPIFFSNQIPRRIDTFTIGQRLRGADIPIQVVGEGLIVNTRSSLALLQAGIPQSEWTLIQGSAALEAQIAQSTCHKFSSQHRNERSTNYRLWRKRQYASRKWYDTSEVLSDERDRMEVAGTRKCIDSGANLRRTWEAPV